MMIEEEQSGNLRLETGFTFVFNLIGRSQWLLITTSSSNQGSMGHFKWFKVWVRLLIIWTCPNLLGSTRYFTSRKKKLGNLIQPIPSLPPVKENREIQPEPKCIMDHHVKRQGHRALQKFSLNG